ncbi:flagellar hook protein FlgE [Zymobacter palmae]|uniref:Flagellar hook protein FlgE n=1 Tax=Zymobacter palmae TaxID=33074 RepID=A0A348HFH4_9GAMM|nr:flagellar hook protein FlgE [Zymobacter palmae]BBG30376.1 flagellar hook protein FlgE [Zymobacter palmae]
MSFTQGVSGLKAASSSLDTIGNNISNSQTVGFKGARTEFADIYAGATGIGTRVTGTSQDFSSGSIEQSSRELDLAINGSGFFRLTQGNQTVYSRNGQFNLDKDGYLVNSTGGQLTGYTGTTTGGEPAAIQVNRNAMAAKATTSAAASYNLNSNTEVGQGSSRSLTVYDSQGNSHSVQVTFTKTASNTWDAKAAIDGRTDNVQSSSLVFDSNGQLTSGQTMALNFGDLNNGTSAFNATLDFTGSTQYSRDFSNISISQDGYKAGDYSSLSIDSTGQIIAKYSNDQKQTLGTIVMGTFSNMNGLSPIGDTAYVETTESGQALLGTPGTGALGSLQSSAREASNVDTSSELVNMIVAQRNYQANSQTIKTQDQILQTVMSMKS